MPLSPCCPYHPAGVTGRCSSVCARPCCLHPWKEGSASEPAATADAVVFEGARLIVGDGSTPIENATLVVEGGQFIQVGATTEVEAPAGAAHVDLAGMTVMPAIIDTHTHLSPERDALIGDLRRRAYYGIGAAMSLGRDTGDLSIREEEIPGAARFRSAGVGITAPEPGRSQTPYWVTTEEQARQAVAGAGGQKRRYCQNLGR